jgi:hypothetical protein
MWLAGTPESADLGQFVLLTSRAFAGFGSQAISEQIMGVPDWVSRIVLYLDTEFRLSAFPGNEECDG